VFSACPAEANPRILGYKKGLLIDVRGNSGGWTEYFNPS
jgi:hypothetical protein